MDVGSNGRVQGPLILRTYSFVFLPGAHAPHLNMPPRLLERKEKKSHILVKRKEKKRTKIKNKKAGQAARSLHQVRKKRHIGPMCRESPPMGKIIIGDLEGGWEAPAPDQGLESILFFQVRVSSRQIVRKMHGVSMHFKGSLVDPLPEIFKMMQSF